MLLAREHTAAGKAPGVEVPQQLPLLLEDALAVAARREEVGLGVHDDAVAAREGGFEERVRGGYGDAAVAALEDQAYAGEDLAHGGEGADVVAEVVGARQRGRHFEDGARREDAALGCGGGCGAGGAKGRGHLFCD